MGVLREQDFRAGVGGRVQPSGRGGGDPCQEGVLGRVWVHAQGGGPWGWRDRGSGDKPLPTSRAGLARAPERGAGGVPAPVAVGFACGAHRPPR